MMLWSIGCSWLGGFRFACKEAVGEWKRGDLWKCRSVDIQPGEQAGHDLTVLEEGLKLDSYKSIDARRRNETSICSMSQISNIHWNIH